jgi:hypothetical protein
MRAGVPAAHDAVAPDARQRAEGRGQRAEGNASQPTTHDPRPTTHTYRVFNTIAFESSNCLNPESVVTRVRSAFIANAAR